jgi:ABC-type branched-subunit amino acid transport system substrate-binding protein
MSQQNNESQSQEQTNHLNDISAGRDAIFAPLQITIETVIVDSSLAAVTKTHPDVNTTPPYLGIKNFNPQNSHVFFGRDDLINKLVKAVNKSNLNLVLGASGSGKSSVIRAGLIPELKKSIGSSIFYDFIFTPNEDPFDSLYCCLRNNSADYSFDKSEAKIALNAQPDTLIQVIKKLKKKKEERWFIFVDQFEELFTRCDKDKQSNFIQGLLKIAKSKDISVNIVLAMRSDFKDKLKDYPDLRKIIYPKNNDNNLIEMTDLSLVDLRKAIEQPAAKHGVTFEKDLVEEIIQEIKMQKGILPLLQYTLKLLWKHECETTSVDGHSNIKNRILTKKSYANLGGVRGALQQHVDKIFYDLEEDEKIAVKHIFLKLVNIVDIGSDSQFVNRRTERKEFVGVLTEKMLTKFIDEGLLVGSYENLNFQVDENNKLATVEIAHEILLSCWDTLRIWIENEREIISIKNFLMDELKRWNAIKAKDKSKAGHELLKGSRLDEIIHLVNKKRFENIGDLSEEAHHFVKISVRLREREARNTRRTKVLSSLAVTALLAAIIGGAFGVRYGTCPTEGLIGEKTGKNTCFRNLITSGDKNVFFSSTNLSLKDGIEAFRKEEYEKATILFAKATNGDITDPVSRIFYNNAKARQRAKKMNKPNSFFIFDFFSQRSQTLKLAVVTSIDSYEIGAKEVLRGVADAQEDFNSHQSYADSLMEIVIANDGNEPEAAKKVAQDLLADSTILGIMGHYASENTQKALEEYKKEEIAIVSSTSSSSILKGVNFFRTIGNTKEAAKEYVMGIEKSRSKNIAIFFVKGSEYSEQLKSDFMEAYGKKIRDAPKISEVQMIDTIDIIDTEFDVKTKVTTILNYSQPTAVLIFTSVGTNSLGLEIAKEFTKNNKYGKNIKLFVSMALSETEVQNRASSDLAKEIQMVRPCTYNEKPGFDNSYIKGSQIEGKKEEGALARWNLKEINWRTVTSYDAIRVFGKTFTDLLHLRSKKTIGRSDILKGLKAESFELSSKTSPYSLKWSKDDNSNNQRQYCLIRFDEVKLDRLKSTELLKR